MTKKEIRYQQVLEHQLSGIYDHMCNNLLSWVKDDEEVIDRERLSFEQLLAIGNVNAIEEEWLLDPKVRDQLSLVQWEE
tara:strand:- start:10985 stop:11221 length:237 start_codon:yes stop_codon:yes gene_type:complete